MKIFILVIIILFASQHFVAAQEASWFVGVWKGGALERKKASTQNLQTTLTIETVDKDSFAGVVKVMLLSDTSVHYDSRVKGIIRRNYLSAELGESIYKKDPPGGKWETRCKSCGPIQFIYSLQNGRFVLTGEIKNCLKTCNGISVYSRGMNEFTPVAQKSLESIVTSNAIALREAAINDSLQAIARAMKMKDSLAALARLAETDQATLEAAKPTVKNKKRDKEKISANSSIDSSGVVANTTKNEKPTTNSVTDSTFTTAKKKKKKEEKTISAPIEKAVVKTEQPLQPALKKEEVFEKRPTTVITAYNVSTDSITLHVFDNGIVDGDTVSVFYNDAVVIYRLGLTTRAFVITLPIDQNADNKIVLYAHNLGEIPPNSAMLEIYSGKKIYSVTVTSDLQKSSSVVLHYKKE